METVTTDSVKRVVNPLEGTTTVRGRIRGSVAQSAPHLILERRRNNGTEMSEGTILEAIPLCFRVSS